MATSTFSAKGNANGMVAFPFSLRVNHDVMANLSMLSNRTGGGMGLESWKAGKQESSTRQFVNPATRQLVN